MSNHEAIAINSPPEQRLAAFACFQAGGTGVDSWNGIILPNKKTGSALGTKDNYRLLAPTFGIRAFRELTGENAPLANLAVILTYWNEVSTLRRTASN